MFAVILVVLGLFFFGGDAQGDAVNYNDLKCGNRLKQMHYSILMYGLFGIAVAATVIAAVCPVWSCFER